MKIFFHFLILISASSSAFGIDIRGSYLCITHDNSLPGRWELQISEGRSMTIRHYMYRVDDTVNVSKQVNVKVVSSSGQTYEVISEMLELSGVDQNVEVVVTEHLVDKRHKAFNVSEDWFTHRLDLPSDEIEIYHATVKMAYQTYEATCTPDEFVELF